MRIRVRALLANVEISHPVKRFLFGAKNMEIVDMREFIPDLIVSGVHQNEYVLHVQDNDDHYYVWYETPIVNQKGFVGTRTYDDIIPKYVVFDEDTFEVIGLLQGEMSKTYRQTLTFANSEPGIMNKTLAWFERTGFAKKSVWKWYVRVNLREPTSAEEIRKLDQETVEKWIDICNLDPLAAYEKRLSFVSKTNNEKLSGIGTLMIERSGPIVIQTVQKLVSTMTASMPTKDEKEIVAYMRGIIAAEGCVNHSPKSGQRKVFVTAVKEEERNIFKKCFEKLGIIAWESKPMRCILVTGRENVLKLHELSLLTLHPDKHKKFLEMLSTYTDWWHERRSS